MRANLNLNQGGELFGLVVANYGHHLLIESEGKRILCKSLRDKKRESQAITTGVVGDRVRWRESEFGTGSIVAVDQRKNIFFRNYENKIKSFAANIDMLLVFIAAEPKFSTNQLSRALIAAEAEGIPSIIALNKSDLGSPFLLAWERLEPFRDMGYTALQLSLKSNELKGVEELMSVLQGKVTLIIGPSGSGKSTLVNILAKDASLATAELSHALRAGRHTTTTTTLHWVTGGVNETALIDSPGFQDFGLDHLDSKHLATYMPDLRKHVEACHFRNCMHIQEPDCGITRAIGTPENSSGSGFIQPFRYAFYKELFFGLNKLKR